MLGRRVPLESPRGYHVTVQSSNLALRHTLMAPAYKLSVNPIAMGLRLADSGQLAGLRWPPGQRRADLQPLRPKRFAGMKGAG